MKNLLDFWRELAYESTPTRQEDNDGKQQHAWSSPSVSMQSAPTAPLTENGKTYSKLFREELQKMNEIGMTFIRILFQLNPNPKDNDYKQALSLIMIMNPSVTIGNVKESVRRMITYMEDQSRLYTSEANNKREQLMSDQKNERQGLESAITGMEREIGELRQQLQNKESELSQKRSMLTAIDDKYQPQLDEVETKKSDIQAAVDEICTSLNQILSGINQ